MSAIARKRQKEPVSTISSRTRFKKYRILYLMLIPGAVWFILFHIIPLHGIAIAFQDYDITGGVFGSKFVGFLNFEKFISSAVFPQLLKNTIFLSFLRLAFSFPLPIIFALCLNELSGVIFKRTVQTISYLPYFLSWVIVTGLSFALFNDYTGVFKGFFETLGLSYSDPSKNPATFVAFIITSGIWKGAGWGSIIYLAAIAGIDHEIVEASVIDGAGRWKRMLHITLPTIAPTIAIMLILSVGSILSSDFEQLYLFQGGQRPNPLLIDVSDTFDTWIYRSGITKGDFSVPTAVGIFQSFFGAGLIFLANKISKRLGYEGVW